MTDLHFDDRKSKIIVSSDFEKVHSYLSEKLSNHLKPFYFDTIKIEDVRAIIKEAYIKQSEHHYIAISSNSYSVVVQNALLKVLEEPPEGISFLILAKSKSSLLGTVRSRLIVYSVKSKKAPLDLQIDLGRLGYKEVFEFIKSHERCSKEELVLLIEAIVAEAVKTYQIQFYQKEYDLVHNLYRLAHLNTRPNIILSTLLVMIMEAQKR